MAAISQGDVQPVVAKVKILINAQLKQVLKKEGLAVSGVKIAMQERIIRRQSSFAVFLDVLPQSFKLFHAFLRSHSQD